MKTTTKKKLKLNSETVRALHAEALQAVNGGLRTYVETLGTAPGCELCMPLSLRVC